MIRAAGLTLRRGVKVLLENAEFVVHPGERVGIVGKNGAGKSSLFSLLQGHIDPDAGTLDIPASWRLASVEQILHDTDRPAREFVIDGDRPLRDLQARRAALDPDQGQAIAELEAALIEAEAWSAPSRAEQLLAGLGFAPDEWTRPVASFSGGWQMRIALARALMAPSDLLLLDEPTNHLDLDAMLWLERWLASYPGTVLLISHDTEFLDAVARVILHFEQDKLVRYKGDYESFLEQRAERLRQNRLAIQRQTREAAHLQSFIDRFKAKATKAKQAQSRVKALARMQTLAPLAVESGIDIRLPEPAQTPDVLLTLEDAALGYPAAGGDGAPRAILRDVGLMVRGGSRIGILGVNGAGKSTLVKTLARELQPLAGGYRPAKGLEIGYFAQQQLDVLDPELSPLQHFVRIAPDTREQELRNMLGGFGFGGDMVSQPVAPFSGGEKARLALALIVWRKPNLLLLDEPSNHLDVDTREALARALAEFPGSVLLVSHDRHLLRTTVDSFWIVADGRVQPFDGDLEDYRDWLQQRQAQRSQVARAAAPNQDRKAQRREQAQARQELAARRKPLEARLKRVEDAMAKAQARLAELDALMADPDFYTDAHKDARPGLMAEHGELNKALQGHEEDWLDLQTEIEALGETETS
ncbi:ABC-F family ATP-binding cassette domain-containing protein [Castellaniella sp. WN]